MAYFTWLLPSELLSYMGDVSGQLYILSPSIPIFRTVFLKESRKDPKVTL